MQDIYYVSERVPKGEQDTGGELIIGARVKEKFPKVRKDVKIHMERTHCKQE